MSDVMKPIDPSTETVLRTVIADLSFHRQFAPLLDEIDRLRSVLAALREPSDAVVNAAALRLFGWWFEGDRLWHDMYMEDRHQWIVGARETIRAAVAAAEKEVRRE